MGKRRLQISAPKTKQGGLVAVVDARTVVLQTDQQQLEHNVKLQLSTAATPPVSDDIPSDFSTPWKEGRDLKLANCQDEVKKLGSSVLKKWEKSEYKKKEEMLIGFAPAKNLKMPITRLNGMRMKNQFRENFQRRKDKGLGLTVRKKSKVREVEKNGDAGVNAGDRDRKKKNKNSIGSFKNGVLMLNKKMGRELGSRNKSAPSGAMHGILGGSRKRRKY